MNIYSTDEYQARRNKLAAYFSEENRLSKKETNTFKSYTLEISYYRTGEGTWNVSRGMVTKNDDVIADIKRNYSAFPYLFIEHANGKDYLLCGEDYQGYTIVNLTEGTEQTYIPEAWKRGGGFCWAGILNYDEDTNQLEVEGCYWACPFERVIYDFSNPDDLLPLKELERYCDDEGEDEDEEDEE